MACVVPGHNELPLAGPCYGDSVAFAYFPLFLDLFVCWCVDIVGVRR